MHRFKYFNSLINDWKILIMDNEQYNIELIIGSGASACKDYDDLFLNVKIGLENGIRGFDTAPSYQTEEILGKAIRESLYELEISRNDIFIQTKIDPWQMQYENGNIIKFVDEALCKMKFDYLDSLLIHWPIPEYFEYTWRYLCKLREDGILKNIGICNVRSWNIYKFNELDVMPDIIQIERHPLRICEKELDLCAHNNITVQAYSPLCKMNNKLKNSNTLKNIARKYNKSVGQVILRWHIDSGVIPVFTSTKPNRIKEYSQIFDFCLTSNEIREINLLNQNWKLYLESCICPGL